jgi:hypothetical protein
MSFLRFCVSSCFKYLSVLIFAFSLASCSVSQPDPVDGNAISGSGSTSGGQKALKVSWNAPLKREDETTLDLIDIKEYRVYYGSESGVYDNEIIVPGNSTFEVEDSGVPKGTYYVVVTAVDVDELESGYSQEIVITV